MTSVKRREFLKTVGAATASMTVAGSLAALPTGQDKPNIVFILADDMGYGDVSSLNAESLIPTPNIDRLTHAGIHFTDAHSPSALCTPTRYGVLTGRYCWRTRVKAGVLWGYSKHLIEPERVTVPSLLKANGYNTGAVGKWHLGMDMPIIGGGRIKEPFDVVDKRSYTGDIDYRGTIENGPRSIGFDSYYGISASLDMHPYIYIDNDRFVGECTTEKDLLFVYEPNGSNYGRNMGPAEPGFEAEAVMPTITRKTVQFIEAQSKDKPFFMYMSLTAPHIPIVPSKKYQGRSKLGPYGDFCIEVDDSVGQVLAALENKGLADNTLVVFSADNGCAPYIEVEQMIEQGHYPSYVFRGYKSDIFEGGHRVPFVARWPAAIKAGSQSDETICLTDLLATCASIVGAKLPNDAGEDSYDVLTVLLGQPLSSPIREATVHHSGDGSFSIRQGRWKLENTPGGGGYSRISREDAIAQGIPLVQLYDLKADIGEKNNVANQYPEVIADLNEILERYKRAGRSTPMRT